jgi:hypothetical protein
VHQLPPKDIWEIEIGRVGQICIGQTLGDIVAIHGPERKNRPLRGASSVYWESFKVLFVSNLVFQVEILDLERVTPVFRGVTLYGTISSLRRQFLDAVPEIEFKQSEGGGFDIDGFVGIWSPVKSQKIATVCVTLGRMVVHPDDFLPLSYKS